MKWNQIKLGDAATFVNGYPFKPTDWSEEGLEILRIQNLTKSTEVDANRYNGKIADKYLVRKGDLLISWSGTLGIYEWQGDDAWLNQHIFKVVFDKIDINKRYFKYLIQSKIVELERQVHGATMKHITKAKFDNVLISLPPLNIQEQLADTLGKADALLQKDLELQAKYNELAQAVFYEMFGDPENNKKNWKVAPLSFGARLQGGYAFKSTSIQKSGVKLLKISNVSFENVIWDSVEYLPTSYITKYSDFLLNTGDIVMALTRPIIKSLDTIKVARVKNCDIPCLLNQRVARVCLNLKQLNSTFLLYLFYSRYFKNKVNQFCSTSLQPNISTSQIESIEIPYPPLEIQEEFEQRINLISEGKDLLSIGYSKTLYKSLMSKFL